MNHIELNDYPLNWVFQRPDMGLDDAAKATIKPATPQYAKQVWQRDVSRDAVDLERLEPSDWLANDDNWQTKENWETAFDSDDNNLPVALAEHLDWDPQTMVFICYDEEHVIETRFRTFANHWKAFLFASDQALVIGRKRKQVLWFIDESQVKLGERP